MPLAELADAETLPLAYLEHLAAKLRAAGLVVSQRGAHGGYRLARPAAEIQMLEVVEVLEGPIAPMECFEADGEGRVLCSHEADGDHACSTKLLWTRVHGGITSALAGNHPRRADRVRLRPLAGAPRLRLSAAPRTDKLQHDEGDEWPT